MYDGITFNALNKLKRFNQVRLCIDQRRLRRLNYICKLLSHSMVMFCIAVVCTNSFMWWFMQGSENFARYVVYCAGAFIRFTSYAILTNQIVTYYLVIRTWYQGINDFIPTLSRSGNYRKIRLLAEADKLIKDFNAILEFMYSIFILLSCVVSLTELIHAFIYFFVNSDTSNNEFLATVLFIFSLVAQMSLFTVGATSAVREAQKTAHIINDLFVQSNDNKAKEEVEILSLQLLHRRLEFTACGFFKLDYSLLHGMGGAVVSYVLILIQLTQNIPLMNVYKQNDTTH
ncbi:UNVERIFIED_CONTAM: hypothetical protein PYX00_008015 [Menopon gallinae]|uniref:Gustatory receptor n=1 Tax=Menopon gallinae TaxID=328185 RepID=A0AAW2HLK3_9NEOP